MTNANTTRQLAFDCCARRAGEKKFRLNQITAGVVVLGLIDAAPAEEAACSKAAGGRASSRERDSSMSHMIEHWHDCLRGSAEKGSRCNNSPLPFVTR